MAVCLERACGGLGGTRSRFGRFCSVGLRGSSRRWPMARRTCHAPMRSKAQRTTGAGAPVVGRAQADAARAVRERMPRFGRTKPSRLEFLRRDSPRAAGRITREQFRARFERILKERFPDAVVDSLTAAPDLEPHRTFRKLAQRTEDYFSAVTEEFRPNKKEGKRPGLNQYHFPGCVLEVIKILDVNRGKRLP